MDSREIKKIDFSHMNEYENYRIIDIGENSDSDYEKIPFKNIVSNPYCVGTDFIETIVLLSKVENESFTAAEILIKHGLKNVYVFAS